MVPLLVAGSDITGSPQERYVLDGFGLSEKRFLELYPVAYQRLLERVKPGRLQLKRASYREKWWIFAEPRPRMRRALRVLDRYIATSEVSKHRIFEFRPKRETIADGSAIILASSEAWHLGVLSSRFHVTWALRSGGRLEDRPRYQNSVAFDPFPFPDTSDEALKQRVRDAAEKLDALRKQVLERHPDLTLTKLYNTLEALRAAEASGAVLGDKERDIATRGCVSLIRQYHDAIDAAVAEAYGGDLVPSSSLRASARGEGDHDAERHGGGVSAIDEAGDPSTIRSSANGPPPHRARWGGATDEIILERLVALNKKRVAEEAKGKVRWLRPDYQAPGYVAPAEQEALALPEEEAKGAEILAWPSTLAERVVAVAAVVERAGRPVAANDVARAFKGKRAGSVTPVLDALAGMGRLRKLEDGRFAA